ncbi:MAG TPA: transketolase [Acidimicrobiales bacterium]|nr:transketolase [Acidimicrobiales bacterium]
MTDAELEAHAINVIRGLAMDAPNAARSGHQGTAMALAPLAHVLFTRVMTYDASAPGWFDRDRFILSAGHASILQYAFLHLTGFGLTLEDLKAFRQWGSATPGHPESHTPGVEVTTGPLGQGFANGVGMGVAERHLRARFGADVCDHHTFVICSDGDLSEGVSHEAASLAGHLGLGRLIYVYDDNHISIDGPTELALSDDAPKRFEAYGWHVENLGEAADDLDAIEGGLRRAMEVQDAPSLLVLRSHIAFPSPTLIDTPGAHGLAFDDATIAEAKQVMGLPDEPFFVPDDVLTMYRSAGTRGRDAREAWEKRFEAFDGDRAELDACLAQTGRRGWTDAIPTFAPGDSMATRSASGKVLAALVDDVPGLIGGGADLTGNTNTTIADRGALSTAEPAGRQLFYGIREHAMGALMNGMAHHGGVIPIGGTFLVFSDYMRGAVRLAALSQAKSIFVWTHDSVGVGEDGPTHQPVEQVASLRAIPDLRVFRPADANEVAHAWRLAIEHDGPSALILTRQNVPVLEGTIDADVAGGAYVLLDADDPAVVLAATGSEVHLCVDAAKQLAAGGIAARVVSMPCWELFEARSAADRGSVLPSGVPTLGVEAGSSLGWHRWADEVICIDRFGASAPGQRVLDELGMTADHVASTARKLLGGDR